MSVDAPVLLLGGVWEWLMGLLGSIGVTGTAAAIVGIGLPIVVFVFLADQYASDDNDSELAKYSAFIKAAVAVVGVGILLMNISIEGAIENASEFWWMIPLAIGGWVLFIYLRYARTSRSASSALGKTRRSVRRNLSSRVEAATGVFVVGLAVAAAVVSGMFAGLSGVGDILLMFSGELAYLATTAIAYVQLGGSLPFDWVIPTLSARQFVTIALVGGALGIMVKQSR